jgi:CelD/BcsL family acetyltransferase involved in cellulose biosynthesis
MQSRRQLLFDVKAPSQLTEAELKAWTEFFVADTGLDSGFYSPGFALACEGAFGAAQVCIAYQVDGQPIGFFPFQRKSGLEGVLGMAERIGGEMSDYSGLVLRDPGTLKLGDFCSAADLGRFDINHSPMRPPDVNEDIVEDQGGPVTDLKGGFDAWWAVYQGQSKSRASDLGRRRRKLEREIGEISFTLESGKTSELLDRIIDEKCEQYRRRGARDIFENGTHRALIHALAKREDAYCQLIVSELYAGDVLAASHIGLRCGDVLHYWFPVFNEDLKRTSPGRILILEMLRAAPSAGISLLDYGLGESRTKAEFSTLVRPFIKGTWKRPGLKGGLASAYQSLRWRLQA